MVSLAARSDPQVLLMPHYEVSVEQTIEVTWHITAAEKRDTIALLVNYRNVKLKLETCLIRKVKIGSFYMSCESLGYVSTSVSGSNMLQCA